MHKKAYKEGLTMKKWYRKTVTRTIVLVVAILSGEIGRASCRERV